MKYKISKHLIVRGYNSGALVGSWPWVCGCASAAS